MPNLALLLTASALAAPPQETGTPAFVDPASEPFVLLSDPRAMPPALEGVWRARGYGWIAELGPDGARLFDHSPAGCLTMAYDAEDFFVDSRVIVEGERLRMTNLPGHSTVYTLDRLDALPAPCGEPHPTDPVAVFDYFHGVMKAHYAYFELRGIDWEERGRQHRPRVTPETGEAELWEVLCDMLRGFDDAHLWLTGTVEGEEREFDENLSRELDPALEAAFAEQDWTEDPESFRGAWFRQYGKNVREHLLRGEFQRGARGQVIWGRIGWIGYVNVRGMGGFAPDDEPGGEPAGVNALFSRILTELADTDGLILDITLNTGGYDEVQMAIAGHFTDETRLAFTKLPLDVPPGVEGVAPQPFFIRPAEGTRYLGPVSLVTSDFTVSAGEDFTLAMRQLPHVTHRGSRTRGAFSDVLEKRLPNGWMLNLSNEAYLDVDGRNWEAHGVPPEVEVPIFVPGNVASSHVEAILAIADAMLEEL